MTHNKIELINRSLCNSVFVRPYTRVIQTPELVYMMTPDYNCLSKNRVYHAAFDSKNVQERVHEVVKAYDDIERSFFWFVSPGSKPDYLAEVLQDNGLCPFLESVGMVLPIDDLTEKTCSDVRVEWVTEASSKQYYEIIIKSYTGALFDQVLWQKSMADDLTDVPQKSFHFLIYYNDIPVGTGGMILFDEVAYLVAGAVLPNYRGRGIFKSVMQNSFIKNFLKSKGVTMLTAVAVKTTSAPILSKLGFETVCEVPMYINRYKAMGSSPEK